MKTTIRRELVDASFLLPALLFFTLFLVLPIAMGVPMSLLNWDGFSPKGAFVGAGNYLKILAARGFVVANVDYSIAPGATWPTPTRQVNAALSYLQAHADDVGLHRQHGAAAVDEHRGADYRRSAASQPGLQSGQ